MRLPGLSLLSLLSLLGPLLLILGNSPLASAKMGTACFKVVAALVGRPGDIFQQFQTEICDRGCQPTVPHWDLWTRNNTFAPAVRAMMKRVDSPRQEEEMMQLGDDVADIIKKRCGPMLQGRDICADDETLAEFGNCFKKQFLRAALVHLPRLLPMASDEICSEQLAYLQTDELWQEIIPGNMREYAQVCRSLGVGMQEL